MNRKRQAQWQRLLCLRSTADRLLSSLALVAVGLLVFQVAACDAPPENEGSRADTADSTESAEQEESRLVTLGGPVTEIVFALGAGDQVVAVDESSTYPEKTQELERLDYVRQTSVEAVLAQSPDRVLASEGMGPPEVIEQLEEAGVTVELFAEPTAIDEAAERIVAIGDTLQRADEAAELVEELDAQVAAAIDEAAQVDEAPRAVFLYARGPATVMMGGKDTGAAAMIDAAGGEHFGDFEGFRPVSAEGLIEAAPEVVVMTEKGMKSLASEEALWSTPGLDQTPAGADRRVVAVEDLALLGFGPRMGDALGELNQAFKDSAGDDSAGEASSNQAGDEQ